MTNGIEVQDYVVEKTTRTICKVIAVDDHARHYANLHLIFIDNFGEICHVLRRADEYTKIDKSSVDADISAALDGFYGYTLVTQKPAEDFDEIYPGHKREHDIQNAIQGIVSAADRQILSASDGSCEETDYITFRVAEAFLAKLGQRAASAWQAKQLGLPRFDTQISGPDRPVAKKV